MDFDDHDDGEEEEEEEEMPPSLANTGPLPSPKPISSTSLTETRKSGNSSTGGTRYRECMKNHAVNIGGSAVDGCGEFMAAGEDGTLDALHCAACNCHRNFHRKEPAGSSGPSPGPPEPVYQHPQFSPYYRTPAGYLHHHHLAAAAAAAAAGSAGPHRPMPLALPSTSGGGHSRDEGDDMSHPMGMMGLGGAVSMMGLGGSLPSGSGSGSGKKRFRTKFSQEQKDKMLAFAERVGWRIQKHDEQAVQQFCNEISVKRHVLKVWMHNNKHTLGKKP
ncbi:hypothetical protein LUZ60_002665 [Juncus effusus]|nr:hypothetical protein LUZ60_002665 [Juncus effusus]